MTIKGLDLRRKVTNENGKLHDEVIPKSDDFTANIVFLYDVK